MRIQNGTYSTKALKPVGLVRRLTRGFPAILLLASLLAACNRGLPAAGAGEPPPVDPTYEALILEQRNPEVPDLPFADNPDPSACGIPIAWGKDNQAWLNGVFEGELIQPVVFLYDSHLRLDIAARAEHGSEVEVLLYQENPVTDYYLVKVTGMEAPNEGWIPEQLLSFDPVAP